MAKSTAEKATKAKESASLPSHLPADEAECMHNARKVLLGRMAEESGDDLVACVHTYERLLKLDKKRK